MALPGPDFDTMQARDPDFLQFIRDRVIPVASHAIDTEAGQKMGFRFPGRAEHVRDAALMVADAGAPSRANRWLTTNHTGFEPRNGIFSAKGHGFTSGGN